MIQRKHEQENGLGVLALILLLIVPMVTWIAFDWKSAGLVFLGGLLIVAVETVEEGK